MNQNFDNTNNGALFKNDRKQNEKSPDFKGSCEPACPECGAVTKYWLSAWKKKSRGGQGFLSLAFTADESRGGQPPKPDAGEDPFDFDDDVPF